jgi:hypothetical protein
MFMIKSWGRSTSFCTLEIRACLSFSSCLISSDEMMFHVDFTADAIQEFNLFCNYSGYKVHGSGFKVKSDEGRALFFRQTPCSSGFLIC